VLFAKYSQLHSIDIQFNVSFGIYLAYDKAARIDTYVFISYGLARSSTLSTEHHMLVSIIAPGWGLANLSRFTHHLPRTQLLLTKRKMWVCNNRGVILTLIIHQLGPSLVLPWGSAATLAIWSGHLPKVHTRKTSQPII